ncbi:U-box domain-containing protein 33-like [Silene latifolia]|uniref:U-box domain-containing protein 33-like n=1 Tax=Silene latifolia TaxID=37657 RepID=UPI003D779EAD
MDLIVFNDEYDEYDSCDVEAGGGLIRHKQPIKVDKLYVAVGKDLRNNESLLLWAIQNSGGCVISVIHVHQPDEFIPILGKKHHWSSLNETQVRKYRGIEEQLMLKTLDEYLGICRQFGVEAEKLYIEMDSIEHGIMQLINCHNIEKLVIGAASDDSYHVKMIEPKSKKAVYLLQNAPASCHIWFICKGNLVHQREGPFHMRNSSENERSSNLKPLSVIGPSDKSGGSSQEPLLIEEISHFDSRVSSHRSRELTPDFLELHTEPYSEPNHRHLFSPQAIAQAKSFESLYVDELKKRKQLEEELESVINDRNRLREELRVARDQNLELEGKVANFDLVVKDLEDGLWSNMELLQISEEERDALKNERDSVLKTAEELLNQSAEASTDVVVPKFFTTLTFADIKEATNDFNPVQQLWEGENGSIYRGVMSCTPVTVKIWHPEGVHGPEDFHREVEILSKFRHPNVVTVMGVSPDAWALVYEYLPNGSLEDRLSCKDNTPSLSWKTRLKIATDLCSALIFLHSQAPQRVVHTTLNPTSVFLDSNFSCKIIDFGFSHLIPHHESPHHTDASFYPQSSLSSGYMDPEFLITGEINPAMDIFSFGMILLELLTGKPAAMVTDELEIALDENNLGSLLDASAGDWPFVQANQLASLAFRCCAENSSGRPDLELDVWRALDAMRASCGASPSQHLGDEEHREAPSYFMCPIFQEVMKDPHIASDGYTYEAEALKGWLDAGHDTSPMTNLQLAHCNLVPNHALRSAIQEWRQQP